MIVYRLSNGKYKNDLSGKGAELAGGRWNSKGTPMLYTGQSRALCTTELAVHAPLGIVPINFWMITIEIPDTAPATEADPKQLPSDWKSFPHPHCTQEIGDKFVQEGRFLVMKVPSAVVAGDYNYLVNPTHPLAKAVRIVATEPFELDERLFIR
ncbi:RES family NAD+ phosphorylase [Chitinophaga lutea]